MSRGKRHECDERPMTVAEAKAMFVAAFEEMGCCSMDGLTFEDVTRATVCEGCHGGTLWFGDHHIVGGEVETFIDELVF